MKIVSVIVEDYPLQSEFSFPYLVPDSYLEEIRFGSILLVPFGIHNQPRLGFVIGFPTAELHDVEIKPIHQLVIRETISKAQYRTIFAFAILYQVPISKMLAWCGLFPKQAQPVLHYRVNIDSETSLIGFRNSKSLFKYLSKHRERLDPILFRKRFRLTKHTTILKKLENRGILTKEYASAPVTFQTRESASAREQPWLINGLTQEERLREYIRYLQTSSFRQILIISPNQVTSKWLQENIHKAVPNLTVHYGSKKDLLQYGTPWDAIIIENSTSQEYQIEIPFSFHHEKIAFIRSRIEGFQLIIGSYLPSLFCYQGIQSGAMKHLSRKPKHGSEHPKIVVRSMTQEIRKHGFHMIPFTLQAELEKSFKTDKKSLLLLNRKGYANILLCQHCSSLVICPKCESPMMLLSDKKTIRCRSCGYTSLYTPICEYCGHHAIRFSRFGTEKLEEEAKIRFPAINTLRMDKNKAFPTDLELQQARLIIGTTVAINRVDWDEVNFCCILGMDARMNFPMYHNQADIFFLFAQLSEKLSSLPENRKKILVFSFTPMAEIFQWLSPSRLLQFYHSELKTRKELRYPPFTHLLEWRLQSKDLSALQCEMDSIRSYLLPLSGRIDSFFSRVEKIDEVFYSGRILMKSNDLWNLSSFFRVKIDELKKNEKIVHDVKKWEW